MPLHEVVPEEMRRELSASVLEDGVEHSQPIAVAVPAVIIAATTSTAASPPTLMAHGLILGSVSVPVVALLLCFSVMGFGDVTYISLNAWEWPWYSAAIVDGVLAIALWLLDVTSWRRPTLIALRRLCLVIFVVVAGITCLLATKVHPLAPLLFGLLLIPACVLGMRHTLLKMD